MAERKQPRLWIEFALEPFPVGSPPDTTLYRWASRPYAGDAFIEGRVSDPITITRSASAMSGEPSIDVAIVVVSDTDGLIRELLDAVETQWFENRETAFKLLSEAAYIAGLEPRILFGGRVYDAQPLDNRKARMEVEDLFAQYLDREYPQYTLGDAYPFRFTDAPPPPLDPNWAVDDPGLQIPVALRDVPLPIYFGPFVDTAVDPLTGLPRLKGLVPTYFMGYTHLTAGTGTVGEPSPELAAILGEGWGGWGELVVGLGEYDIPNVYGTDLHPTDPTRTVIPADRFNTEFLAPGHPGWPFATDYVMRNGYRVTVIYARGPALWSHLIGQVSITVDVCGWKSAGSPSLGIDQAGFAWQEFLTQHVLAHGGAGYTSGPHIDLPTYADGRAMFWTSQIQAWQAMTAERLGTDKGYLISMALTEKTPLRDILRTFNVTFDSFTAKNGAGQAYLFSIDDLADPTDGVRVREHIELTRLPAPKIERAEIENEIHYTAGWDPEQQTVRTITLKVADQPSQDALAGTGTPAGSGLRFKGIRDLRYTSDDATATDVIGRRLMRLREAPRYQPLPVRMDGVDREIGEQVRVSHRDGLGPRGVGYQDRPMVILRHHQQGAAITMTAVDVERTLTAAGRWADDVVPEWDTASAAEQLQYGFWTDEDGTIPPDGVRGSEWR